MSTKVTLHVEVAGTKTTYTIGLPKINEGEGNPLFRAALIEEMVAELTKDAVQIVKTMEGDIRDMREV